MNLAYHNVSHAYGSTPVLQDISFAAAEGEILCLLGPSGGGKSTLLRLAAGLEPLQQGHITLGDQVLAEPGAEPAPEDRPVGLVFQDHVLFPHLTVARNIAFGIAQRSAAAQAERIGELLEQMDLSDLGERYPHELSGGQQQRVALARALAPQPGVLLLDEPFASVDATLRRQLRTTTQQVLRESGTTAIVVTHDPDEAMALADSIAVITHGRVVQHAPPTEVWRHPRTLEVAALFGDAQLISATNSDGEARCWLGNLPCDFDVATLTVAVRPEGIRGKRRTTAGGPGFARRRRQCPSHRHPTAWAQLATATAIPGAA